MFNKRIGLCDLAESEGVTMAGFCEDSIFNENLTAKIWVQGSEEGFLADIIMSDEIYVYWSAKLLQIKDDNPMLWALILNEANYWEQRFQSLEANLRRVV